MMHYSRILSRYLNNVYYYVVSNVTNITAVIHGLQVVFDCNYDYCKVKWSRLGHVGCEYQQSNDIFSAHSFKAVTVIRVYKLHKMIKRQGI